MPAPMKLPEGQYQTVAGFMLDRLGHIPQVGDGVKFQDWQLTVKVMARVKIEEVEVHRTRVSDQVDSE